MFNLKKIKKYYIYILKEARELGFFWVFIRVMFNMNVCINKCGHFQVEMSSPRIHT
jgi:hypothetical protein